MKISVDWLKEKCACSVGVEWFVSQKETDAVRVLKSLISEKYYDWANWTITRVMERKQYLAYAIYAAEQVIDIYEKKYPGNDKPRKAIEAAKDVLKNDTLETRNAAADAADAAYAADAYAAASAASAAAAGATSAAAAASAAAAYAVYADAAAAATSAAAAADAAAAVYAAAAYAAAAAASAAAAGASEEKMQFKILNYGLKLLTKKVRS